MSDDVEFFDSEHLCTEEHLVEAASELCRALFGSAPVPVPAGLAQLDAGDVPHDHVNAVEVHNINRRTPRRAGETA